MLYEVITEKQPQLSVQRIKDPVQQRVMQLIAEQTGYPTDMLDLELDMEADLGIDTVKQAEIVITSYSIHYTKLYEPLSCRR